MPAQPGPARITPHAERLRDLLEGSRNQWLTRREIAMMLGKRRLTPYEIDLLHLLGERGHIHIMQEEGYSREGFRWIYGVFDEDRPPPPVRS